MELFQQTFSMFKPFVPPRGGTTDGEKPPEQTPAGEDNIDDLRRQMKDMQERLDRTENPRHRKMLQTVRDHLAAEVAGSLDALMATLVPDPEYHLWGNGVDGGPKSAGAVRAYYASLVEDKRGVLEFDIDRIVCDDDTVVTEGWYRALNRGAVARKLGFVVDDDEADYLVTRRIVLFWPFNQAGEMLGEDGIGSVDPLCARKLDPSEPPEVYPALFAGA